MKKLLTAIAATAATPALAHHPLGGETPATMIHGFLSGIGHPMLGLDHLAFLVAAGIAGALMGRVALAAGAFVAATLVGTLLTFSGLALPGVEPIVAFSVLALGVAAAASRLKVAVALPAMAAAGLFHGLAYGGAIVGAEPTPLVAYLAGLAIWQTGIALLAGWLAARAVASGNELAPRLTAAVAAGVGVTFLFEMAEGALFAV